MSAGESAAIRCGIEAVDDVVALTARHDEAGLGEPAQALGEAGRGEPDERAELLRRPRPLGDQLQDPQAGVVAERAQDAQELGRRHAGRRLSGEERRGVDERRRPGRVAVHAQVRPHEHAWAEEERARLGDDDVVLVRQVDQQLLSRRVRPAARRQPPEHGPDARRGERPACLGDAPGQERLDPLPLVLERRVPVVAEQPCEPPSELDGIVQQDLGELTRCLPVRGCTQEHRLADTRLVEHPLAVAAAVVVERPAELLEREFRPERLDPRELLVEALRRAERARHEEVRQVPPVEERERLDLPLEVGVERAASGAPSRAAAHGASARRGRGG